jgi:hypothetical protein
MKTIIAALLSLSLASFTPAHNRAETGKPATAAHTQTGYYHLPAAFKYLPRQVIARVRANYVKKSEECGVFQIANPSATVPARVIVKNCDGTESEIWLDPGTNVITNCLDTFNTMTFTVVEGQITFLDYFYLCTP